MNQILIDHNKLVERWKRYEKFCENESICMDEKLKWIQKARELTNQLSLSIKRIQENGIPHTEQNLLEGFEVINDANTMVHN